MEIMVKHVFPQFGMEHHEHGEEFKTSCQHIKHKNKLRENRKVREILSGSDHGKSGPDIIYSRCYGGEIGNKVITVY